jgi:hypothetical protein
METTKEIAERLAHEKQARDDEVGARKMERGICIRRWKAAPI